MNVAYITKLGWMLCTQVGKTWVKLIRSRYLRGTRITDFQETSKFSSWIWKGVKKCKDSLDRGLCYKVGLNSHINIIDDPWMLEFSQYKLPKDIRLPTHIRRVGDLMTADKSSWDVQLVHDTFPRHIYKHILSIPISKEEPDRLNGVPLRLDFLHSVFL